MARGLSELKDPDAVLSAIAEFDDIGRDAFLRKYGFRQARAYHLVHGGKRYDSKAIVGAALGYQNPELGPLRGAEFFGGDATVKPKLESLGFVVAVDQQGTPPRFPDYLSNVLNEGEVYSRERLAQHFAITDATLNTGVFQPKGSKSIWLFVTEKKTSDRTQYVDHLEGDLLHWEGQTSGRTDLRIIRHEADGNELLVFYRQSKQQHPQAGFTYEGRFRYLTHSAGNPSSFVLQRIGAVDSALSAAAPEPFDPTDVEDGRQKVVAMLARRQGQPQFRRSLLSAYEGQCAISGNPVSAVLEAAHIHPYQGEQTNCVTNGLLLRADLHTLFDLRLLWIDEEHIVRLSSTLLGTPYSELNGTKLRLPKKVNERPSGLALQWHRQTALVD